MKNDLILAAFWMLVISVVNECRQRQGRIKHGAGPVAKFHCGVLTITRA